MQKLSRQTLRYLSSLLFCFVCLSLFNAGLAYAKINTTLKELELTVSCYLNKQPQANISLLVTPDDSLLLKYSELMEFLRPIANTQTLEHIEMLADERGLVNIEELQTLGIGAVFELLDFSLKITLPLSMIKEKSIPAVSKRNQQQAIKSANYSGYINVYSSYVYQSNQAQDYEQKQLTVRPEAVLNLKNWVIENEAQFVNTSSNHDFKRLGTRVIHDLPIHGMRFSLGDNYSAGSYFQSTTRILGLSLAHDFTLVSDRTIRPSASQRFTLDSPSSVEVYIDDRLFRRLNLPAGIYSLDDIPLIEGNNHIVLKITDNAGVTKEVNFTLTTGLDLFSEGQLEYEFHFGYPAQLTDKLAYDYDQPLFSGFIDYGISTSWTAGFSAQGNEETQQLGIKQIFATPIGQLSFENAINLDETNGYAYRFAYSSFRQPSQNGTDFSIGYEYSNPDFYQIAFNDELSSLANSRQHFIQANLNFMSDSSVQTSLFANVSRRHEQTGFEKSTGVTVLGNINTHQWYYSLGGQWQETEQEQQWSFNFSLSYQFSYRQRLKLSHQSKYDKSRLEFAQNEDQRFVGALNLRAGLEKNNNNEAVFDLNSQYNTNRLLMSFDHGTYYQHLNGNVLHHQSRVSAAASIAFAGSQWGIGKPIQNSFALVSAHPSLAEKTINLGSQGADYLATNSDLPTLLLANINAYDRATVAVDVEDLAPGYDLGAGSISFYPSYKSGHDVVIGSQNNISMLGTLKNSENEPLALQVGEVRCIEEQAAEPYLFFTSKTGRFALTGLKPCQYQIVLKDVIHEPLIIDIDTQQQLHNKGVIYVH